MTKLRRERESCDRNNSLIVADMFLKMRSCSRNPSLLPSPKPSTVLANRHNEELEYLLCRLFVANLPRALTHVPKGALPFFPPSPFFSRSRERRSFSRNIPTPPTVISVINGLALTTRFVRFDRLFVAGGEKDRAAARCTHLLPRGDDDSSKGVDREHECWAPCTREAVGLGQE